jgi:hypothetical protein
LHSFDVGDVLLDSRGVDDKQYAGEFSDDEWFVVCGG